MQDAPLDVVLAEDDEVLRETLRVFLAGHGFAVRAASNGEGALALVRERRPDLLVLDVMMPGRSGVEVCREVRASDATRPGIVLLSALGSELDVVLGLESGADDYVVKPCRPRELVARLNALRRRVQPPADPETEALSFGALTVDPAAREARVRGALLGLTATEFALLLLLARAPGRVFTRAELLERVWNTTHAGYARNVDCHVARLRRKLGAAGLDPLPVETVQRAGYRFTRGGSTP